MNTKPYPVITIDGPSGAGKGTLAYRLAQKLQFQLLDSGALYRIVGLLAYQAGLLTDDMMHNIQDTKAIDARIGQFAQNLTVDFVINEQTQAVDVCVDGAVWAYDIRNETVGAYASFVAKLPSVRKALLDIQQKTAQRSGVVADGRDMGTVVFVDAPVKIFLTASATARAQRRVLQLQKAGKTADEQQILTQIKARDYQDENRAVAPLRPAADALIIDSSDLDADAVFVRALAFCAQKGIGVHA